MRLRGGANAADYGRRFVRTRGFEEETAAGAKRYVSIGDRPLPLPIARGLAAKAATWQQPDTPYWVIQMPNFAVRPRRRPRWHEPAPLAHAHHAAAE